MKLFLNILFAVCTLAGQVIPFEATEWGIKYLNAHPTGIKLLPLLIGVGFSFLFTCTISPIKNATKGVVVGIPGKSTATINPFWGWLIVCFVITVVINLMLE